MYLTNYAERAFLNTFLGIAWPAPIKIYVGLFLSNPTDTGTSGVEISYTGYQRQMVNFGEPVSVLKTTTIKNTNSIIFPKPNKKWVFRIRNTNQYYTNNTSTTSAVNITLTAIKRRMR